MYDLSMDEREAEERLTRLRARAESERLNRAEFKRRRDYGLTRRHAARLAMLAQRTDSEHRKEQQQT